MGKTAAINDAGRWRGRPWALLALDAVTLAVSVVVAYEIRTHVLIHWRHGIQEGAFYAAPGAIVVAICLGSMVFHRLYEDRRYLGNLEGYTVLVRAIMVGVLVVMAVTFLFKAYNYSRGLLLTFWAVGTASVCVERFLLYKLLGRMRKTGFDNVRVAAVTLAGHGKPARAMLVQFPELGYRVVREIAIGRDGDRRRLKALESFVRAGLIEMVVIGVPERDFHRAVPYLAWCEENYIPYHRMSVEFDAFYQTARGIEDLVYLESRPVYSAVKALFDRIVALAVLVAAIPVWAVIAVIIKVESPGPVLFVQERVGRNGKLFRMFKFRTMHAHAPRYAVTVRSSGDRRVTAIGRLLRRTSLDELPQLINVLAGEMSLVGPRPEMPFMASRNTAQYRKRLMVLPGLTGLWQAMAREVPLEKALPYDLYYIKRRSFLFDLVIILRTVYTVAVGRGAR